MCFKKRIFKIFIAVTIAAIEDSVKINVEVLKRRLESEALSLELILSRNDHVHYMEQFINKFQLK